jgi:signal transduction histidine kinase
MNPRSSAGALQAIERYSRTPRFAAGRDPYGRLIAADARLLSLQLMSPSDARFQPVAEALAAIVNDYDTLSMPSSQRLFVMGGFTGLSLPTYAAEQLAAEFLEADGRAPAGEALEPAGLSEVWKQRLGSHAIALFRTANVTAMADAVLRGHSVANEATFALLPPGRERGTESLTAGRLLPGWHLSVALSGTERQGQASRRVTSYLWTGSLAVAGLAVAGLLLWQAFRRQMHVNRLKTDLVAAVSHELRTPLTSMRALVDLLLENPAIDGHASREYLQMIAGENARLSRLIEHVLTFARVDRDRQALVFRDVSPAAVVREAAAIQGRERFPGLTVDVAPDLALLYGDQDALVTVLLNLLENAYKYSGDDRRVLLRVRQDRARVVIEVADNGIGIARRDWKRIFRPFYQVDQRLARERGGCGLGLSIVDFIVRAHGGHVMVESRARRRARPRAGAREEAPADPARHHAAARQWLRDLPHDSCAGR